MEPVFVGPGRTGAFSPGVHPFGREGRVGSGRLGTPVGLFSEGKAGGIGGIVFQVRGRLTMGSGRVGTFRASS